MPVGAVIGFDLDMTLVDSRPGIAATLHALAAETETTIDVELVLGRLGPVLEEELAHWFPAGQVGAACDRFRALYADLGVPGTFLLPGAREAIAAARGAGCRVVVITAKYEPNARRCLEQVGLAVDAVDGWRFGLGKGAALLEHGASCYVGDTPADVVGARAAGAVAIGVTSGAHAEAELRDAGADPVLESLREFPAWCSDWLASG